MVLYDALSHPALLDWCRPDAERRNVGKRYGQRSPDQSWITSQLIELAREGKCVARLKGGDPLLFARGAEEAEALADAGIAFEIVPGISSPVATTAYAGISMTHRDLSSSVTFITGSDREGKQWSDAAWKKLATATDTICVLMGMRRIREITQAILDGGRGKDTPVAVIQWGARPQQRVAEGTLESIADRVEEAGLTNPAIIVVGEVTRLRSKLAWYDSRPLFGQRVMVPRPPAQARTTAAAIRERGAQPIIKPLITIEAPPDPERFARAIACLNSYDWVLFTSANGVTRSAEALEGSGKDARAFGAAKIACIGPKTAQALHQIGIRADLIAREYIGEGLAEELLRAGLGERSRVLLLRALEAREALPELLARAGALVDVVPAYETKKLDAAGQADLRSALGVDDLGTRSIDVVLFTSSSTAHAFADAIGSAALPTDLVLASIGPVTSASLRERGLRVDVEAERYTVDGLLDALEAFFVGRRAQGLPSPPNPAG